MITNIIAPSVERIYITAGATPLHAMRGLPKIGCEQDAMKGFYCVSHDVELIPRGFFDWLFRRPNQWKVTARFVPLKDSPPVPPIGYSMR